MELPWGTGELNLQEGLPKTKVCEGLHACLCFTAYYLVRDCVSMIQVKNNTDWLI